MSEKFRSAVCVFLALLIEAVGGAEIHCGRKMMESDLAEIRRCSDYVGTEARINENGEDRYLLVRHYRHKKLDLDIIWKENKVGIVRSIAVTKTNKDSVAVENFAFCNNLAISYSAEKLTISRSQTK